MTRTPQLAAEGPVALASFTSAIDVRPITIWRWRKNGWLKTINIAGRQYITREEIERFNARAIAGEFAKSNRPPSPKRRDSRSSETAASSKD